LNPVIIANCYGAETFRINITATSVVYFLNLSQILDKFMVWLATRPMTKK